MQQPNSISTQDGSIKEDGPIIVKFVTRGLRRNSNKKRWSRQLPGTELRWDKCQFTFDIDADKYDWFVVYHDLPRD